MLAQNGRKVVAKVEDYYSIKKIMEIIKYYHLNINNLKEATEEELKSVGVSKYGLDSSLPKGNSISNVVEKEAIRRIENSRYWAQVRTDIKYVQDRWHRITDEREAQVLSLYLDGYRTGDIAELLNTSRWSIYRTLERIANGIKGYPQEGATVATNFRNESLK